MFPLDPKPKTPLQKQIDRLYLELGDLKPETKEYAAILDQIVVLEKLKADHKPKPPSSDTLIMAGVHLLGIAMIIRHENLNIITSKAMSFVPKPR